MRFTGTKDYVATQDLEVAVNAAIVLERPLLVKGEPGTGKTVLAEEIAKASRRRCSPGTSSRRPRPSRASTSTTRSRACATASSATRAFTTSPTTSRRGKLWDAFTSEQRPVLLIDEIDKADIEFPNDLLLELDRMEFHVYETGETVKRREAADRRSSPRTTRRSCPTPSCAAASSTTSASPIDETMEKIVEVHYPGIKRGWSRRRCASSSTCATCRA